jgi:transcriptional regulator with XRE-family HTH domain
MAKRTKPNAPAPGQLVRDARRGRGWSQAELAKRAGISQAAVSKYERGDPEGPSRPNVLVLALVLGLDPTALDPSLEGIIAEAPEPRGIVQLTRCEEQPGHWHAEGPIEGGYTQIRDADVGMFARALLERGIALEIPLLPPIV